MNYCNSCLKENIDGFCKDCLKKLFDGKKVSPILSFSRPEFNDAKIENGSRLSISGVQIKHSLKLEDGSLVLKERGGEYILKPVPTGSFQNLNQAPANEHVTMQIASQVFGIKTAVNAIVQFSDGEYAYLTRRFDLKRNGDKYLQEDFGQVARRTEETHGKNYKYDFSYEEIAELIKKYVGAYPVEIEKFYKLILFNYLVCNGDAHLKNFSLYRNDEYGDYLLTPAYDLLNTSLHVPGEPDTALELFKNGFMTEAYQQGSKYTRDDFYEFGIRTGMRDIREGRIIMEFLAKTRGIQEMVNRSFLNDTMKTNYLEGVKSRIERIKYSYKSEN